MVKNMKLEKRLSHAIKSGNQDELELTFEFIYQEYKRLIGFVIASYIDNIEDIKDLTNDTFLEFFAHASSVHSDIKYYLISIAKRKTFDHLKKKNFQSFEMSESMVAEDSDYSSNLRFKCLLSDLKTCLESQEINIILRHLLHGETFKEIAHSFNKNENTIRTIYFRSLKKVKKNLFATEGEKK